MIKITNVETYGWQAAIRGMRNPMNSWDNSDSSIGCVGRICKDCGFDFNWCGNTPEYIVWKNDISLMIKLAKAGRDHAKYRRMITVTMDITAPLYWWKEFDTYKVGTVANSCSTMHTIHKNKITENSFSLDHVRLCEVGKKYIEELENLREKFNKTKDDKYWYALIQLLPSSYNQLRTVQLNYEVLSNIYHARKDHKLDEWRELCQMIEGLPYSEIITLEDKGHAET